MRFLRQNPVLLACLCLIAYFAYHSVKGPHGLEGRRGLVERARILKQELATRDGLRRSLEREVALLAENGPDPDFVEELARDVLAYARPGDIILLDKAPATRPSP